jgi:hypothetical protein
MVGKLSKMTKKKSSKEKGKDCVPQSERSFTGETFAALLVSGIEEDLRLSPQLIQPGMQRECA